MRISREGDKALLHFRALQVCRRVSRSLSPRRCVIKRTEVGTLLPCMSAELGCKKRRYAEARIRSQLTWC